MSDASPEDIDVEALPRLSFEQLITPGYDCLDLQTGVYRGPRGRYYRSPYTRPGEGR
jgi:hypothetical protein